MAEGPLTAEELHFIDVGYIDNELLVKLKLISKENEQLRAAVERHKECVENYAKELLVVVAERERLRAELNQTRKAWVETAKDAERLRYDRDQLEETVERLRAEVENCYGVASKNRELLQENERLRAAVTDALTSEERLRAEVEQLKTYGNYG